MDLLQSADDLRRENEALRRRIARTRADLDTLVETSPVGVAVFDALTGRPVSINREAARLVEALGGPGQPPERLIEAMTCRFADGRELALARLPLSEPAGAVALRAEEIELGTTKPMEGGALVPVTVTVTPTATATVPGTASVTLTLVSDPETDTDPPSDTRGELGTDDADVAWEGVDRGPLRTTPTGPAPCGC